MGWNYIIGVRHTLDKEFKTKFHMDSIIKYEDLDMSKMDFVKSMLENKLVKTKLEEAYSTADFTMPLRVSAEIHSLTLRVRANNNITVHKFHTEDEMDEDDLAGYVSTANVVDSTRDMLMKAKIHL